MPATDLQIVNEALGLLNVDPITAFGDGSVAGSLANTHYNDLRDTVLEDSDWSFAIGRSVLTRETTDSAPDLTSLSDTGSSFNFNPTVTSSGSIEAKPDGSKIYILDKSDEEIHQYSVSPAGGISTTVYDSKILDVSAQTTNSNYFCISEDGLHLYVIDAAEIVYQYDMTTAWDISTATYASKSLNLSAKSISIVGIRVANNGTRLYINSKEDTNYKIHSYTLNTAYDISSAIDDLTSFDWSSYSTSNSFYDIDLSDDGLNWIVIDNSGIVEDVVVFTMATAWDISSTVASETARVDLGGNSSPLALCIASTAGKIWTLNNSTDIVYELEANIVTSNTVPAFTWAASFLEPTDKIRIISINGDEGMDRGHDEQKRWVSEQGKVLTNYETANCRYVKQVTDPTLFSPTFTQALVAMIAWRWAIPLTKSKSLRDQYKQDYADFISNAALLDGQQGTPENTGRGRFNNARYRLGKSYAGPTV